MILKIFIITEVRGYLFGLSEQGVQMDNFGVDEVFGGLAEAGITWLFHELVQSQVDLEDFSLEQKQMVNVSLNK